MPLIAENRLIKYEFYGATMHFPGPQVFDDGIVGVEDERENGFVHAVKNITKSIIIIKKKNRQN